MNSRMPDLILAGATLACLIGFRAAAEDWEKFVHRVRYYSRFLPPAYQPAGRDGAGVNITVTGNIDLLRVLFDDMAAVPNFFHADYRLEHTRAGKLTPEGFNAAALALLKHLGIDTSSTAWRTRQSVKGDPVRVAEMSTLLLAAGIITPGYPAAGLSPFISADERLAQLTKKFLAAS